MTHGPGSLALFGSYQRKNEIHFVHFAYSKFLWGGLLGRALLIVLQSQIHASLVGKMATAETFSSRLHKPITLHLTYIHCLWLVTVGCLDP